MDKYAKKFKRYLRDLRYNKIDVKESTVKNKFMQGIGSEFIPIRTMAELPTEFHTNDIDELTAAARTHLVCIQGN